MTKKTIVPMPVIRRLPRYHRYLEELLKNDVKRISSRELSEKMGVTASQIRQDLNNYGGFGQQGYGYNVEELYNTLTKILGLDKTYSTIIIGAGNLGQAIANYTNFERTGFNLKGIFDINPKLFGLKIRDIEIMDVDNLEDFLASNKIDIAILCIPKDNSQIMADRLIKSGIKAIWNFSPIDLKVPDDVILENVHLSDSLLTLSYRINEENLLKTKVEEK
ncbi:redox-sensing transcriptional repressor Rex [Thermoanaerobacterium thermosaccharolyticum]|jgi:redox-sensing transcriptional repressor|uniref:Redox-sensing transcriptional repressor Rex n=3 Tax=Thermoanaerobacterium thermosaccharolyticum TaxID=1517 RepID=D9TRN2_THETC|nr:redox-sensing transcriptional repressor Rex [Thermoanaerobacterium thermosaccharolyticum]MDK2807070.1 redox-sensing transcriptional repressor [Thermoanaerobacterium sp.]TCW42165.1 redox-sensing transcriptional repressor [Thermohydrogenium kirishiense]ADL69627.1 CoA-binding domain protein [Thermoanaerobacterium thermosaccharolyticum DSM 571]AGB19800.1 AT-rich DNA-binding protein [Thermoanaerobacterium thermosaccharolyticum M0795]AST56810.1 Rex family transcriptional regulator [Thermoanaeroba